MYENILVPTDGSEGASIAVDHALDIASTYGATLHTVYVVDLSSIPAEVEAGMLVNTLEDAGEEATDAIVERAREAGVDTAEPAVLHGSPAPTILEYVGDTDVDLVVMGTHGRTGLDRFLLGSVTEKVVRRADVPVLTVRVTE